MTHRNQFRSTLGRHDASNPRDLERIALGTLRKCSQYFRLDGHKTGGLGFALSRDFTGDIDHAGLPSAIVVREFAWHLGVQNYMYLTWTSQTRLRSGRRLAHHDGHELIDGNPIAVRGNHD